VATYNQSERQLWRAIVAAEGGTGLYNNTVRQLLVKLAAASGVSVASLRYASRRQLLVKTLVARHIAVPKGGGLRLLIKALAADTHYTDTIRQCLLRLANTPLPS